MNNWPSNRIEVIDDYDKNSFGRIGKANPDWSNFEEEWETRNLRRTSNNVESVFYPRVNVRTSFILS